MQRRHLLLETDPKGVATITFDRPEVHNAFDDEMIASLTAVFAELRGDAGVRAVVIAGRGKSFSAGADLNYMKRAAQFSQEENVADALRLGRMLLSLRTLPVPTVALVQGAAYGGGVGLVAACDIAVAVEGAKFALTEVKLGLVPAMISPFVLGAIGPRQASRYFHTAERFSAADAQRIGLVHEVVADESALGESRARIVGDLLAAGPEASAAAKKLVADVAGRPIDEALLQDLATRIAACRASGEGIEGLSAFLERRSPKWAR